MSRFVRPESDRLEISAGDYLIVKRRLNAGEQRRAYARIVKRSELVDGAEGAPRTHHVEIDPEATGLATIVAYLLDWSLRDEAGELVAIRDVPTAVLEATLLALDPASFREILEAIQGHERRHLEALEAQKKMMTDGAPAS